MPAPPALSQLASLPAKPRLFTFDAGPLPPAPPLAFSSLPRRPAHNNDVAPPAFALSLAPPRPPRPPSPSPAATARGDDNPRKRRRRLTDVDGECTSATLRKKRRLRLTLVTSRLSQPYSAPASNIIERAQNKAAAWARRMRKSRAGQMAAAARGPIQLGAHVAGLGQAEAPLLRRAAILNRLRLDGKRRLDGGEKIISDAVVAPLRSQEPGANTIATEEPFVEATRPVRSPNMDPSFAAAAAAPKMPYAPLAPSPLGTNYDALDEEDDGGGTCEGAFGSDFGVCEDGGEEGDDGVFGYVVGGWTGFQ